MNPDFFTIESKSELIRTVEEHASVKTRSATEANKLIDACVWQIICKKFSSYLISTISLVGWRKTRQFCNSADKCWRWVNPMALRLFSSLLCGLFRRNNDPKTHRQGKHRWVIWISPIVGSARARAFIPHDRIVAKAVTLEKIYTELATKALNELTKNKSVGDCPEHNYLCLIGYPENNRDLPSIIDFLKKVTKKN